MIESIVIVLLGLSGFFLSLYLRWKKAHKSDVFVCPLKGNCTEVIHSPYAKFFGLPVEVLGTVYYLLIAIAYAVRVGFPVATELIAAPLLAISFIALLFSAYLTFIQVVRLRKLCTWCLLSAAFCLSIFLLAVQA
ncbi:MAG: vitamin K epoxide reductase family protein [Patescibacteria group bacterium]